jgi:DNA modification methylase
VVAHQLRRNSIGIEIDPEYVSVIEKRLNHLRSADNIMKYYTYYKYTQNLREIWPAEKAILVAKQRRLF